MFLKNLLDNINLLFANITARYKKIGNIKLELYGIKRQGTVQAIERAIQQLPEGLKNKKIKLQVLNEKYYTIISGDNINQLGAFLSNKDGTFSGRILIRGDSPYTNRDSIRHTTLHEYGHYLDYLLNWAASQNDTFIQIKNAEEKRFENTDEIKKNHLKAPKEYFAESFADYIMVPHKLKAEAPQTYKYIEQIIGDFHLLDVA